MYSVCDLYGAASTRPAPASSVDYPLPFAESSFVSPGSSRTSDYFHAGDVASGIASVAWMRKYPIEHGSTTSIETSTTRPTIQSDGESQWNLENIRSIARHWYGDFENISETYILTILAALGVLINFLAIWIISWDRRMWPMSRILHNIFLFSEQVFLCLVITFLQIRAWFDRRGVTLSDPWRLELLNYLTAALGSAQTFSTWMLYIVAMDAYRSVRQLTVSEKIFQIRKAPIYVVALILGVGGFYSAYIPQVHVEFHKFFNGTVDTLCIVPIENHWDFLIPRAQQTDLYYILYYSVGYTLVGYVIPFFLICCRDKDIIDVLHEVQQHKALLPGRSYVLCPAVAVSVVCNVYLVCVALKMVILTFKIFEYADDYMTSTAFLFFRYLNVYSNFLQVLKSSLHFFILMIYNKRLRKIVLMSVRKKKAQSSSDLIARR